MEFSSVTIRDQYDGRKQASEACDELHHWCQELLEAYMMLDVACQSLAEAFEPAREAKRRQVA